MPDAPAPTTAAIANSGAPDSWRDRDCAMSSATRPTQSTTKIPSRPDRHEIRELCGSGTSNSVKGERPLDERPIEGGAEAETAECTWGEEAVLSGATAYFGNEKRGRKNRPSQETHVATGIDIHALIQHSVPHSGAARASSLETDR